MLVEPINHFYRSIQGWSEGITFVYARIISRSNEPRLYKFVEVGTWRGRSAAYMAVEIANSDKQIDFYCVDTWRGSDEVIHQNDPSIINDTMYEEFLENLRPVEGYFRPLRMPSVEAAKVFEDFSLDFVFIDAQHDFQSVRDDILAWLPKIKLGGVIAGHDYHPSSGVGLAVKSIFRDFECLPFCWFKVITHVASF